MQTTILNLLEYCKIIFLNIHTSTGYDTKLKTHNINNENNEVQHK
jgi:hypothetical protein